MSARDEFTPKQLAAREEVSTSAVYSWIRLGMPAMRRGLRGRFKIVYADFVAWMVDCARASVPSVPSIPAWAYRKARV